MLREICHFVHREKLCLRVLVIFTNELCETFALAAAELRMLSALGSAAFRAASFKVAPAAINIPALTRNFSQAPVCRGLEDFQRPSDGSHVRGDKLCDMHR